MSVGFVCVGGGIEDLSGDIFFVFVIGNDGLLVVNYGSKGMLIIGV